MLANHWSYIVGVKYLYIECIRLSNNSFTQVLKYIVADCFFLCFFVKRIDAPSTRVYTMCIEGNHLMEVVYNIKEE
jgi:hypothetical protein